MTPQPLVAHLITPGVKEIGDEQVETTMGNVVTQQFPNPPDPSEKQHLRLIELSGVLDFWENPKEDIYTPEDGEAL